MEICRCAEYKKIVNDFKFFLCGTLHHLEPRLAPPENYTITWIHTKVTPSDPRSSRPILTEMTPSQISQTFDDFETKWIPVLPGLISQKIVNQDKSLKRLLVWNSCYPVPRIHRWAPTPLPGYHQLNSPFYPSFDKSSVATPHTHGILIGETPFAWKHAAQTPVDSLRIKNELNKLLSIENVWEVIDWVLANPVDAIYSVENIGNEQEFRNEGWWILGTRH